MANSNPAETKPNQHYASQGELLFGMLQHGVMTIMGMERLFDQVERIQGELVDQSRDPEEAARFYYNNFRPVHDGILRDRLTERSREIGYNFATPIGYSAILLASRDGMMEGQSKMFSGSIDVQRFTGVEVTLTPIGEFDRDTSTAIYEAESRSVGIVRDNEVTGTIAEVSPLDRGTIVLEDTKVIHPKGSYRHEEGKISHIFASSYADGEMMLGPDNWSFVPTIGVSPPK